MKISKSLAVACSCLFLLSACQAVPSAVEAEQPQRKVKVIEADG